MKILKSTISNSKNPTFQVCPQHYYKYSKFSYKKSKVCLLIKFKKILKTQ